MAVEEIPVDAETPQEEAEILEQEPIPQTPAPPEPEAAPKRKPGRPRKAAPPPQAPPVPQAPPAAPKKVIMRKTRPARPPPEEAAAPEFTETISDMSSAYLVAELMNRRRERGREMKASLYRSFVM